MPKKCYNGPNPIDEPDDRIAVWKWVKENHIDHGATLDKVGDAINQKFYGGAAKPEWITDILSGRKTPFREVAADAWTKQYYRRQIQSQAKDLYERQMQPPILRAWSKMWEAPRNMAVAGHGFVFPITHAGDLLLRPLSYKTIFKGLFDTYTKTFGKGAPAKTEQLLDTMRKDALFNLASQSGLDVKERAHKTDLVNFNLGKGSQSERAWSVLTTIRFNLWKSVVKKLLKPGMSWEEQMKVGSAMAEWANHATGSSQNGIVKSPMLGATMFGPKLTQSKIDRLITDPGKTIKTFANWGNASAGEKAAARTRLSGLTQYALTYGGMLLANQGVLWATGQKDKDGSPTQVNWANPFKGDWMAFKGAGLEGHIPGLYSELKLLGQIMALTFANSKEVNPKNDSETASWGKALGEWALGKATPVIGLTKELATGRAYPDRPIPLQMPWYQQDKPGKPGKPPSPSKQPFSGIPGLHGWDEYLISHGPIPLQGPLRYVYDQMRERGASATDAMAWMRSLIAFGLDPGAVAKGAAVSLIGATGIHVGYEAAKAAAKREQVAKKLLRR